MLLHLILLLLTSSVYAKDLIVEGWPFEKTLYKTFDVRIANDPIVGRMSCPALTRLNLVKQTSELLLLKSLKVTSPTIWNFTLKNGLYWWDNSKVVAEDLKVFLGSQIAAFSESPFGKWIGVPPHQINVEYQEQVQVNWESPPKFGPYFLNGLAFHKSAGVTPFSWKGQMCAGLFRLKESGANFFDFVFNESYGPDREFKALYVANTFSTKPAPGSSALIVKMAKNLPFQSLVGGANKEQKACSPSNEIELPLLSVLQWNLQNPHVSEPRIRTLLTKLTPRGAFLREGAAGLGSLPSSLLPRSHPGYNHSLLVKSYDPKAVLREFQKSGWLFKKESKQLVNQKDLKPMVLVLGSTNVKAGVLEKLLQDSFVMAGIQVVLKENVTPSDNVDATIKGVRLSLPELDFFADFHSMSGLGKQGLELDRLLEKYSLSLTFEVPQFQVLQAIHKLLYEQEPFSVLQQQHACVEGRNFALAGADFLNPDWFKNTIF